VITTGGIVFTATGDATTKLAHLLFNIHISSDTRQGTAALSLHAAPGHISFCAAGPQAKTLCLVDGVDVIVFTFNGSAVV